MQKSKFYRLAALLAAAMFLFNGCVKKETKKNGEEKNSEITMAMYLPESFNPLTCERKNVSDALSLCYEPLFMLNDELVPEGVIAEKIVVSDDCLSAVITIKDSVLWHDGVKLTSADVVYTVEKIQQNPESAYYECVKNIKDIHAIDPLNVKVQFTRPYGQISYSLSFPIIASHNAKPEEKIIGTGPYEFEEYLEAVSLTLRKNDKWHGGDAACEKARVLVVRDSEVAASAFNTGSVNTVTNSSFDMQNSVPKANSRITQYPSVKYEFIAFNHKKGIFSSAAVRAAISDAIDRNAIVKDSYMGAADAANAPVHPVKQNMTAASVNSQYNLANAGEMLFLEGYSMNESTGVLQKETGESLSFTLLVNKENEKRINAAQQLCAQLFAAGIEVKVKEVDFEDYSQAVKDGSYDAYLGGVIFSNLYDFEFLFGKEAPLNTFGYDSEYMSAALSAVSNASTEESLTAALINFDEVFQREQPLCGLVFEKDALITSENVMGKLQPKAGMPYMSIEQWSIK